MVKTLLVIGTIVAALVVAGTAAAGGQGAYVYKYSACNPTPFGVICLDEKSVTTINATPSGNSLYIVNGTIDLAYTQPFTGCSVTSSQSFHTSFADQDGEAQSHGERYAFKTTIGCDGSAQTCTTTVAFHYGRGEIQFDRSDVVCTDE
jgi:hypothetical protein